eukprot:TRINITY_DN1714_c0_g1_i2.p1 TRINITY_DN1714_c0_g1~~TRINITY_DN1714_c0_g1_i2.p1  ORF type:complete len:1100 (+),score=368.01 TRINITY_DN1714_c0_g1_i2:202-3501(+)
MSIQGTVNDFYNILKNFLHNSNEIRALAEKQLKEYLAIPGKTLFFLIQLMQNSPEDFIRKLSSVLFKRFVAQDDFDKLWNAFRPEEQEAIKRELLEVFKKEQDPKVMKQICQAVARLAGQLFIHKQKWPEIEALIMEYIKGSDFMAENAFRILAELFTVDSGRFMANVGTLQEIFDSGFQRASGSCLVAVAGALCILVTEIDTVDTKIFEKYSAYMINLIEVLYNANDEDNLHEYLELVSEVAELEPRFFRRNYLQLSTVLVKISKKKDYVNDKLRQMPLESLVSILERMTSLVKKHKTQVLELCSALFDIAVSIEDEVDEEWLKPKEGYDIEDDLRYDDNVNFAVSSIDRLLSTLPDDDIFPVVERIVEHSMSNPDWRFHNAGLMIAGQIGEYCESTNKVKNLVPLLVTHVSHSHPKVRAAALYAIGILADDMKPDFQNEFAKELLPPMVAAVEDPVPHVQSRACAALTNFLEEVDKLVATEVAVVLLPKLVKSIQTGISIVKENAVSCIGSIAESAEEDFRKYYAELVQFLVLCYRQFHTREYRQLQGLILETLSVMAVAVGKEQFTPFAATVIELMTSTQDPGLARDDPLRAYLLTSWQRICILLGKDFAPYLHKVIPGVFKIAESMPVMGIGEDLSTGSLESVFKEVSDTPEEEADLQTSETEEKSLALQMLQVFSAEMEADYVPYIEATTKIAESVLTFFPNQGLRKDSANLLPSLLRCLKKANVSKDIMVAAGSKYITSLLNAHDKEIITEVKSAQVLALKDLYEIMDHFMSAADVKTLAERIFKYFKDSEDRKVQIEKYVKDCKDDDEDEETVEEGNAKMEDEEEYQKHLSYFLGAIEKSHKDEFLPEVQNLLSNIVQPYLLGNSKLQTVAVFLLDDLVEYLGVEKLGEDLWKQLAVRILNYATHAEHAVRQAACYGVGALAINGGAAFSSICVQCLTTLASAVEIKKDEGRKDLWGGARDNAVASIGKILKHQSNTVSFGEIWSKWLHYLPITVDMDEGKDTHLFVVETVLNNPEMAVGSEGNLLPELIRVFIKIFNKKLIRKKEYPKLAQALKKLNEYPAIAALLDNYYKTKLSADDQATLQKILSFVKS